ncbi:expressed unknown protein [Seminavis robusta]|uniref:Uncharacterized protein n=1 Tax=Seminavis robusta TaxID=568900 RepID=A0A9N8DHG2_9STRA|nr:expressed unknown protein [Seminavis robusta]|eukprot:Sro90_g047340.1 n/a (316) ;mRNA; f:49965-51038
MPKIENPDESSTSTSSTNARTNAARGSSSNGTYTDSRINAWVTMMVLSMVALIVIEADMDHKHPDFQEQWSLSMSAISMGLGFFAVMGHAVGPLRNKFASSMIELVMALICVVAWSSVLPMLTDPDDGLAVNHNFQMADANLYFASWGSFIVALVLLVGVGKERGASVGKHDVFAQRWLWLIVSSLVVMGATSRMFGQVCAEDEKEDDQRGNDKLRFLRKVDSCTELKVGIALSVVSAVIGLLMVILMRFTPARIPIQKLGAFLCLCMMAIWGVMVSYMTFDGGPATSVGNLYFGVWISGILSLDLGVCYAMSFL